MLLQINKIYSAVVTKKQKLTLELSELSDSIL